MPYNEYGEWTGEPTEQDWFSSQPPPEDLRGDVGRAAQMVNWTPVQGQFGNYTGYDAITTREAGDPLYNQRQAEFEGQTNWGQIEQQLRQYAAERGIDYDPSDMAGIQRNAGYDASHQGAGGGYASAIDRYYANALQNYDQRASNTPGYEGSGSGMGSGSMRSLSSGSGGSGSGGQSGAPRIPSPWAGTWKAPDPSALNEDPGFRFRLGEGLKALQRSAASRGTLLTGGTLKDLENYAQGAASQEYGAIYDRSYNDYETGRRDFMTNEANRYNAERGNRMDDFSIETGRYNMDRTTRMDDFDIWKYIDTNEFERPFRLGQLALPTRPDNPFYQY